jgi:hypothetical protein
MLSPTVFSAADRIFSSGRFQLETLFCSESLISSSIVSSHPSLQTLGLFVDNLRRPLPLLGLSSMLVIRISPCIPGRRLDEITFFPDLLGDGMTDPHKLAHTLQTVLTADIGQRLQYPLNEYQSIHFHLESFENPTKLRILLEAANTIWGDLPVIGLGFGLRSSNGLVGFLQTKRYTKKSYTTRWAVY